MKSLTLSLLAATTICSNLRAQNIDYGALEAVFNEPVTASATGKPQRASDSPVAMEIITADEIKRSGARSIPQLLRRYAGIDTIQSTMGQADVSVRGYGAPLGNRLLVLINGRQVLYDDFGKVVWELLPVQFEEIRQIEVVKGPNSSLFGFNAEQGVINIITYSPLKDDVNSLTATAGTHNFRSVGGVYTLHPSKDLAVRISGGDTVADEYSRDSEAYWRPANFGLRTEKINLDAQYQLDPDSQLRFQGNTSSGINNNRIGTTYSELTTGDRASSLQLGYQTQSSLGLMNVDVYRNAIGEEGVLPHNNLLWVLKASDLIKPAPAHTIRLSMEYRHNSLSGQAVEDSRYQYNLYSPGAMWDWQMFPRLDMVTSLRQDIMDTSRVNAPGGGTFIGNTAAFNRSLQATSYNLSFLYKQTDATRWRLATGRGLHIPSLIEMGSAQNIGGSYFYGTPTLQPESNTSYELGVTHRLAGPKVDLGANLFYEDHRNMIEATGLTFANVGNSKTYGMEFSARAKQENSYWGSSLTLLKVEDDAHNPVLDFESQTPEFKASIYGGVNLTSKWQLDGDLSYVPSTNVTIFSPGATYPHHNGSYFVGNARLNYAANPQTDISLGGYNLLEIHREGPGPQANTYGQNASMLNIGPSLMLKLSHRF